MDEKEKKTDFCYSAEYTDEKKDPQSVLNDFEDAETLDDFKDFDNDEDLYGSDDDEEDLAEEE